jgi:hypothetical protein
MVSKRNVTSLMTYSRGPNKSALIVCCTGDERANDIKLSDGWSVARPLPVCSAGLSQRT